MATLRLLPAGIKPNRFAVAIYEMGGNRLRLSLWPPRAEDPLVGMVLFCDDSPVPRACCLQCCFDVSHPGQYRSVPSNEIAHKLQIPLEAWLVALTKTMYDRELAVSERRVKPASILHNSSLILGKQIIHILPEG